MKVSIIIPSYNCKEYIKTAIDSVLNQSYIQKELIVIDGDSKDGTLEILKSYGDKLTYISEKDNGQSDAINKGMKMATGDIFAWLNADDYYEPNIFSDIVEKFEKHPDATLVYGNCRSMSGDSHDVEVAPKVAPTAKDLVNNGCTLFGPSVFYRAKSVKEVGYLNEKLNFWMDFDLFIRLLKIGKGIHLDKTLSNFLIRPGQKSDLKNLPEMDKELLDISRKHGGRYLNRIRLATWYHQLKSIIS